MSEAIAISFVVPLAARPGDTAKLYSNGGSGDIDWDTPVSEEVFDLFPNGAGNYGFGFGPWGLFPWGFVYSKNTLGFGLLPWGLFPWGFGGVLIRAVVQVENCGNYKFAFGAYDVAGNEQEGEPGLAEIEVHVVPPVPFGLKKDGYDSAANVVTLLVDTLASRSRQGTLPSRTTNVRSRNDGLPGRAPAYVPQGEGSPAGPDLPSREL